MMVRQFGQPAISTVDVTPLDEFIAKVIAAGGRWRTAPTRSLESATLLLQGH
jgi:hypothetical protein